MQFQTPKRRSRRLQRQMENLESNRSDEEKVSLAGTGSEGENDKESCLSMTNDIMCTPTKDRDADYITGSYDFSMSPVPAEDRIKIIKKKAEKNEYEEQRLQRMKENLKALEEIGLSSLAKSNFPSSAFETEVTKRVVNVKKRKKAQLSRRMKRVVDAEMIKYAQRKSPRLKRSDRVRYDASGYATVEPNKNHQSDSEAEEDGEDFVGGLDFDQLASVVNRVIKNVNVPKRMETEDMEVDEDEDDDELKAAERKELAFVRSLEDRYYTCEEYFTLKGIKPKLIQEAGKFTGWVEEDMRKSVGIAQDRNEAWENNGGGKFSFKDPSGLGLMKGQSAKEMARRMLYKNPNSYFYRHTAPGLDHWQGDWTEPENERFLEVAKKYGVGNKWGLFATYIGHRVGYQCSNHYRAHFVEGGLIWDGNFMLDRYGKSIYVGRKNQKF